MASDRNPVLFGPHEADAGFTAYSTGLNEFAWKDRLVGVTSAGFLIVEERMARRGRYEYQPKLLRWDQVEELQTGQRLSLKGLLLGVVSLFLAFTTFVAGWVKNTHVGPGVVTIPLVCGVGGAVLVAGVRRNMITVTARGKTYRWLSPPLAYYRTLSLCSEAAEACRGHGILCTSHAEPA